jgi:hypothetical protein
MTTTQSQGFPSSGNTAPSGGVSPQDFDLGAIVTTVAQGAAQVLPGLIMSLLSAHPQIQQLSKQGAAGGVNPQSLINLGLSTPFGGGSVGLFGTNPQMGAQQSAGVSPQGFDLASIAQTVASAIAPQIPAIVSSAMGQLFGNQQTVH